MSTNVTIIESEINDLNEKAGEPLGGADIQELCECASSMFDYSPESWDNNPKTIAQDYFEERICK